MYVGLHVKYRSFLSDFNESCIFSKDFRIILTYQISWKSVQRELCSPFFLNFAKALKRAALVAATCLWIQHVNSQRYISYNRQYIYCALPKNNHNLLLHWLRNVGNNMHFISDPWSMCVSRLFPPQRQYTFFFFNFNRGHPVVCHFTVKLKIPSKHNILLETNVGD